MQHDRAFVTLMRVMSFIWLAFALVGIIPGAALLAAADLAKPALLPHVTLTTLNLSLSCSL
jgi:hypothetical protein